MCGRYSQTLPKETVHRVFGIQDDIPIVPRFNISPGTDVAAVRLGAEGRRVLAPLRWGFVPPNAPASAQRPINALAEHLG
jgi:putative SOS response-associated peptidase YedK